MYCTLFNNDILYLSNRTFCYHYRIMEHLKDEQEYIDRYDRITVDDCRWRENFHKNYAETKEYKNDAEKNLVKGVGEIAWHFEQLYVTLDWHDRKDSTIRKWMEEDRERDARLATAHAPENIFCNECYARMKFESKHLWDRDKKERVLFFFDCPAGCTKRKALYDDGEEYIPEPKLCTKCGHEVAIKRERLDEEKVHTTYSCSHCSHEETDVFELSLKKEESDPKYEYDRARFCLSGDALRKAQEEKYNIEQLKAIVEKHEAREQNKEVYEKVSQLQKLTVPQLKELLTTVLTEAKYLSLTFEKPDLGRIVSLEFSVEELSTENERESCNKLRKLLQKHLEATNWRLMTDGINYRLGILSGRVRVYESEEDLVKLLEKQT